MRRLRIGRLHLRRPVLNRDGAPRAVRVASGPLRKSSSRTRVPSIFCPFGHRHGDVAAAAPATVSRKTIFAPGLRSRHPSVL